MSSSRKKICMLAATPLTIHFFLKQHLIALAKEHEVTLMVNLQNDTYLPPLDLPIQIIQVPIARKIAPIADLICLFKLFDLFRKHRYDLLITVVPKAGLLGMIAGALAGIKKRLHIFQGEVWANRTGFGRQLLKSCDWITAFLATNILAVSASEKDFLVNQKVTSSNKIQVLGKGSISGVDLKRFTLNLEKRNQIREQLNIAQDAVVLLFMGRLVADKGIHELAEAFREVSKNHSKVYLLLVGPDEENELSKIEVGEAANQIKRASYTTQPESYLAAADILCLPSRREGFGVVIIEAAAMGLPSIGSRIYGVSDAILDEQTGLLFECANAKDLQQCIERLINNEILRNELGLNARKNVEQHYDHQMVISGYIQYINQILIS